MRFVPASLALAAGLVAFVGAQEAATSSRTRAMSDLARTIKVSDGTTRFDLLAEPIYRYDDPTRSFSDGTVWAFGKVGRPAVLWTIALEKRPDGQIQWLEELTSLAPHKLQANGATSWSWTTPGPGIDLRLIPRAPAPADDGAKRLRQMREIARRFRAYEFFEPTPDARAERYELRLLPQPVHRYDDSASGLVDGALFLLAYGRNPEIALLIEARRTGAGEPAWSYGLNRISGARLHVALDDREIADLPAIDQVDPKRTYAFFVRPAPDFRSETSR